MLMQDRTTLYQHAVEVSKDYLGPAAERFLRRQITTHLRKPPEKLAQQDMQKLVDWIRLTFALLTEDAELVNEYSDQLLSLRDHKPNLASNADEA